MRSGPIVWVPLIAAVLVVFFGIWSVFQVSADKWDASRRQRSNWVWMMVFFGPLAVLLFYGTVRQHLLHPDRYIEIDGVAPADR